MVVVLVVRPVVVVLPVDPLETLPALTQLEDLVTPDVEVGGVPVDLHDLTQHQPHQLQTALPAGTDGLGVRQLLPEVFVSLQLQDPLQVAEGLDEGDDSEGVLPGGLQELRHLLDGVGVGGGDVGERPPVREHVLVLHQEVGGSTPAQQRQEGLEEGEERRSSLQIYTDRGGEGGGQRGLVSVTHQGAQLAGEERISQR